MLRNRVSANRNIWVVMIAIAVLLLFAAVSIVTAQGQIQRDRTQQKSSQQPRQGMNYIEVSNLTGKTVYSRDGQEIGDFEDIVFDENRREVAYAVVSKGGFLGFGADLHALPWAMISSAGQENRVTLPIDASMFEDRPGFSGEYPNPNIDRAAQQWTSVEDWTRSTPNGSNGHSIDGLGDAQTMERFGMRKATELIGVTVEMGTGAYGDQYGAADQTNGYEQDRRADGRYGFQEDKRGFQEDEYTGGAEAGEIDDVLINSTTGTIDFALVKPEDGAFGRVGETQVVAVPWARVQIFPDQEVAVAHVTRDEAQQLLIDENDINRLSDPNFRDRFFTAVGIEYSQWNDPNQRNQIDGGHMNGTQKSNGAKEKMEKQDGTQKQNGDPGKIDRKGTEGTNGYQRDAQDPQQRQRSQSDEAQQWSTFVQQCLGRNMQNATETIDGRIESTGTFRTRPNSNAPDGRSFVVSTEDNEEVTVYVGPRTQVASVLDVATGDQVTLKGTRCEIDNEEVFVVNSIQTDNQQYTLSQQGGTARWQSQQFGQSGQERQRGEQRPGQIQREQQGRQPQGRQPQGGQPQLSQRQQEAQDKWTTFADECLGQDFVNAEQTVRGTIRNVGTLYTSDNAEAPDGRRFSVNTSGNQRVKVYVGPSGTVVEPLNFSRGDRVTIRGTRCQIENESVFVATSIEADGETFTLTERYGVPHWAPQGQSDQQQRNPGQPRR